MGEEEVMPDSRLLRESRSAMLEGSVWVTLPVY